MRLARLGLLLSEFFAGLFGRREPIRVWATLLGDDTRNELFSRLEPINAAMRIDHAMTGYIKTSTQRVMLTAGIFDELASHARECSEASVAVIACDARTGPQHLHREHMLFARHLGVPAILAVLTHTAPAEVDSEELLELEELALRDMLSASGWDGDQIPVVYDSAQAVVQEFNPPKGLRVLTALLAKTLARPEPPPKVAATKCTVCVEAVDELESYPLPKPGFCAGEYQVVIGRESARATAELSERLAPGQKATATLTFDQPIEMHDAQPYVFLRDDRLVAFGSITRSCL